MVGFDHSEDRDFFDELFADLGGVEKFSHMFDFRPSKMKRSEFDSQIMSKLKELYGDVCVLNLIDGCSNKAEHVDHFIPLQSNNLNKSIRNLKGDGRKKVPQQSFGSNHIDNLVPACAKCNMHKKNNIPSKVLINKVLGER